MNDPITLDDIRGRKPCEAAVFAFGKSCRVVELTPAQRDEADIAHVKLRHDRGDEFMEQHFTAFWVAHALRNADGTRVIPDAAIEELAASAGSRDFRRLFRAAADMNGLLGDDDNPNP